ncbi:uncharacterized protein LOC114258268 isoform X2 [Camellia sinensis]|uniref:uncharacterized protein LOC114258268 isoform X2 n=1 Tax=Camellia sinensis TaxID=4442 RepID=UPI00103645C8|nr:uncharacterized protein LOC114258268 isoform X2 [Camellia sinensis]
MIGSAVGCTTSAFYGFNHVMPIVQRWVKGPIWLHFLIGTRGLWIHILYLFLLVTLLPFLSLGAGSTCDSLLFSLCRVDRWCCSSTCPTCFFILSFSILTSVIAISNLTG